MLCILYLLIYALKSFETNGVLVCMKMKPRIVTIDLFVHFEDANGYLCLSELEIDFSNIFMGCIGT